MQYIFCGTMAPYTLQDSAENRVKLRMLLLHASKEAA